VTVGWTEEAGLAMSLPYAGSSRGQPGD